MLLSEFWVYHSPTLTAYTASSSYKAHRFAELLCFIRILSYTHKDISYTINCVIILFLLSFLKSFNAGDNALYWSALLVMASRESRFKVTLYIFFFSFLSLLGIAFSTYAMGWSEDIVKHRNSLIGHSWGFSNPNMLAYILQMGTMIALIISHSQKTSFIILISFAMSIITCLCTWSLTSAMLLVAFPILYIILKSIRISPLLLASIPFFLLLASCLLSLYYGPSEGRTTFESRFSIPAIIYNNLGVSLFGQDCHLVSLQKTFAEGTKTLWIDNMYHYLLLIHGIIPTILAISFFSHLLYRIGRNGAPLFQASAICILFNALTETLPIGFLTDFALFYYLTDIDVLTPIYKKTTTILLSSTVVLLIAYLYGPW